MPHKSGRVGAQARAAPRETYLETARAPARQPAGRPWGIFVAARMDAPQRRQEPIMRRRIAAGALGLRAIFIREHGRVQIQQIARVLLDRTKVLNARILNRQIGHDSLPKPWMGCACRATFAMRPTAADSQDARNLIEPHARCV